VSKGILECLNTARSAATTASRSVANRQAATCSRQVQHPAHSCLSLTPSTRLTGAVLAADMEQDTPSTRRRMSTRLTSVEPEDEPASAAAAALTRSTRRKSTRAKTPAAALQEEEAAPAEGGNPLEPWLSRRVGGTCIMRMRWSCASHVSSQRWRSPCSRRRWRWSGAVCCGGASGAHACTHASCGMCSLPSRVVRLTVVRLFPRHPNVDHAYGLRRHATSPSRHQDDRRMTDESCTVSVVRSYTPLAAHELPPFQTLGSLEGTLRALLAPMLLNESRQLHQPAPSTRQHTHHLVMAVACVSSSCGGERVAFAQPHTPSLTAQPAPTHAPPLTTAGG
jgi:hypothetical protein